MDAVGENFLICMETSRSVILNKFDAMTLMDPTFMYFNSSSHLRSSYIIRVIHVDYFVLQGIYYALKKVTESYISLFHSEFHR